MNANIDSLGKLAADTAARAAIAFLERHKALTLDSADKLEEPLRRLCRAALPIALQDAKDALDCGMVEVAQQTFLATFVQAGIEAAREVHFVAE